jgi:hypothetical protein
VAGGASGTVTNTVDRYNPSSNTWAPAAPMSTPRAHAPAITLLDGRVLIPGGRYTVYDPTNTAEVFDPVTGAWSSAGTMHSARGLHGAVRLTDGRVLVVGGDGIYDPAQGAEIWDPKTNAWTPTGPVVTPRSAPVVALLADGSVFVTGGWNSDELSTAELYHPDTNTWTETAPMAEQRNGPAVAGLPDGRVLVAGGHSWVDLHPAVSQTSEIYDPCSGTWASAGGLNSPRGEGLQLNVLNDGRPVVSGGFWWTDVHTGPDGRPAWSQDRYENTVEVFDPATGAWTQSPPMEVGRAGHVAVTLADGSLLIAGGYFTAAAERFYPAPAAVAAPPAATGTATALAHAARAQRRPPALTSYLSGLPRSLKVSRTGRVTLRLRCAGPGSCADTLVLRLRGGAVLATAKFSIPHGRDATIRLTLKKSALRKLRIKRATKVTLELANRHLSVAATVPRRK